MKKFILLLFTTLFTTLSFAAGSRISSAQVAPQLSVAGNYFVNPICLKNDYNITDADSIASCVSSGGLSDAGTSWRIDADASGEKAVWTWTAYPKRLEGGNCLIGGTYTGDFANYEVNIIQNSVTLVTANATGSDFPNVTGKQPFEVSFICGTDNADLVTVEIEATSASAGQLDLIWEQGGENTNIGSAAQAEVVAIVERTGTDQSVATTSVTKVQFNGVVKDTYSEFDPTTNYRFTAKRPGDYQVKMSLYYAATITSGRSIARIYKNGSQELQCIASTGTANAEAVLQTTCVVELEVGDYIEGFSESTADSSYSIRSIITTMEIARFPSASEQVFKAGFPGQDVTSYTPIFTNVTAASSTFNYQCDAGRVYISGVVTSTAAGAASELRIGLPTGFTTDTGATVIVGAAGRSSNAAASYQVLAEDGVSYLTFSAQASGNGALTKLTGAQVFDGAVSFSFSALVPVTADSPCPRTSTGLFKNGVTNSYAGVEHQLSGELNCDASSTFNRGGYGMTAGNRSTTSCAITIDTGVFSAQPWECTATIKSSTVQAMGCSCSSATACTIYGPNADYDAYITIKGPN